MLLENPCLNLPKLDPHVHFEGTIALALLELLAVKNSISLTEPTPLSNGRLIPAPSSPALKAQPAGFADFATLYVKAAQILCEEEDFIDVIKAHIALCRQQKITECHMYFSVQTHLLLGRSEDEITQYLLSVQQVARSEGLALSWVFDLIRGVEDYKSAVCDLTIAARKQGLNVFALGLSGDESRGETKLYRDIFHQATQLGLETIIHAGETGNCQNVADTLQYLKPSRIGHGLAAASDPQLIEEILASEVVIEACPGCNIALGLYDTATHPLSQFVEAGVKVVLGSDDPGLINCSLNENYQLASQMGISPTQLEEIRVRSLQLSR